MNGRNEHDENQPVFIAYGRSRIVVVTAAGANNGWLTLWIDGAQLGGLSGIDAGTSGTAYFDAFGSRRTYPSR